MYKHLVFWKLKENENGTSKFKNSGIRDFETN